jgi:hypothetical protein
MLDAAGMNKRCRIHKAGGRGLIENISALSYK